MRPTLRCLLLFLAGFVAALVPVLIAKELYTVWIAYVGVAVLLVGIDAVLMLPRRGLDVSLEVPSQHGLGDEAFARLRLAAPPRHGGTVITALLDVSGPIRPGEAREGVLGADGAVEFDLPLGVERRGTVHVDRLWLGWQGRLGLVARRRVISRADEMAVVPNARAARRSALEHFRTREAFLGSKVVRHVGEGSEFESLREYVPGLDTRAMNWKATARHRKLIAQEFRAERNHQVVVAVDTGYLMREPLGDRPKLDHAIHASLVLGYAALRAGDRVGFYAFDEKVRAFAEPRGGVQTFERLRHLTAGLEYTASETNYTLGLAELASRLRRRSLVVLLTDFVDTVTAELMVENVSRLTRRHLVVFVTLRDPELQAAVVGAPTALDDLYGTLVAHGFVRERELVLRRLRRLGVSCLDAAPGAVSPWLLDRYLEIKRREQI